MGSGLECGKDYNEGVLWKKDEKGRKALKGRKASLLIIKQYKKAVCCSFESKNLLKVIDLLLLSFMPGSGWSAWPERCESICIRAWKAALHQ